ncbi:acyl carrier protein [Bradyrhizobium barranii subsp. barranii]
MQAFDTDVRDRIIKLVKGILEQNSLTANIAPQAKLVDAGLTSMDMVNLMLGVEAEFDFTIPQSEITPENFQSVETLERMVATQLQLAAAGGLTRRTYLSPGRPCERRDPYRGIYRSLKAAVQNDESSPNCALWLWVPAFAATTLRVRRALCKPHSTGIAPPPPFQNRRKTGIA